MRAHSPLGTFCVSPRSASRRCGRRHSTSCSCRCTRLHIHLGSLGAQVLFRRSAASWTADAKLSPHAASGQEALKVRNDIHGLFVGADADDPPRERSQPHPQGFPLRYHSYHAKRVAAKQVGLRCSSHLLSLCPTPGAGQRSGRSPDRSGQCLALEAGARTRPLPLLTLGILKIGRVRARVSYQFRRGDPRRPAPPNPARGIGSSGMRLPSPCSTLILPTLAGVGPWGGRLAIPAVLPMLRRARSVWGRCVDGRVGVELGSIWDRSRVDSWSTHNESTWDAAWAVLGSVQLTFGRSGTDRSSMWSSSGADLVDILDYSAVGLGSIRGRSMVA